MTNTLLTKTDLESLFHFVSSASPDQAVEVAIKDGDDSEDSLRTRLTLAGFVDILAKTPTLLTARLPPYQSGTSVSLDAAPPSVTASQQWASALADVVNDVTLVDEAALLDRDGIKNTPVECAPDAAAKRKPCKNCSCGLADMLDDEVKEASAKPLAPPDDKSGCGSCSLGDAFRCAACPYLGLPPFKPGDKISVPSSLMTSDI